MLKMVRLPFKKSFIIWYEVLEGSPGRKKYTFQFKLSTVLWYLQEKNTDKSSFNEPLYYIRKGKQTDIFLTWTVKPMRGSKEKTDSLPKMSSARGKSRRHRKKKFHLANLFTVFFSKASDVHYRFMALLWMINNSKDHTVVLYTHYYSFVLQRKPENKIKHLALMEMGTALYDDRQQAKGKMWGSHRRQDKSKVILAWMQLYIQHKFHSIEGI